jgi:hypothetical protein
VTLPIIPPYLARRARVAVIFARYTADAEHRENSPELALLEALRAEILDALDPEIHGGDDSRT